MTNGIRSQFSSCCNVCMLLSSWNSSMHKALLFSYNPDMINTINAVVTSCVIIERFIGKRTEQYTTYLHIVFMNQKRNCFRLNVQSFVLWALAWINDKCMNYKQMEMCGFWECNKQNIKAHKLLCFAMPTVNIFPQANHYDFCMK